MHETGAFFAPVFFCLYFLWPKPYCFGCKDDRLLTDFTGKVTDISAKTAYIQAWHKK
jgi:hypothetical protein